MTFYTRICVPMTVYFTIKVAGQFMPPGHPFPFPFPAQESSSAQGIQFPPLPPSGPLIPPPPLPGPMPFSVPQSKLPVVVMPYYSKNDKPLLKYKRKRKQSKKYKRVDLSSGSDTSDSTASNDFEFRAKRHPKKRRRELLTPVISYVTRDGYVVYQKKIKKDRAKDWLNLGKKNVLPN